MKMEDSELLHLLKQGDSNAFDAIYERYWETLYKHAYFTLRCRDTAMDVVQEVFTWLWQHREEAQISSLKYYLKAATRFKMANHIRSGKYQQALINNLSYTTATSVDASDMTLRELKKIVSMAVSQLPQQCRTIYHLSRDEQLSHAEIARQLNITAKTVENQITIALRRIRLFIGHSLLLICCLFFFY